jgi:hypothetical protein
MARPVDQIPAEFLDPPQEIVERAELLDAWLALGHGRPLAGVTAMLIQHQLSDQVPMLRALFALGLAPERTWWLDIPYTSNAALRAYVRDRCQVPADQLGASDYGLLDPYAPFQHRRAVDMMIRILERSPETLLVLDDGAYVLEALASLRPDRRPKRIAVVEQTTRGFIKLEQSAALRRVARAGPLVDVARSRSKRTLEPPFIAMAVSASLKPHIDRHFGSGFRGPCLVLGYGDIGQHVTAFIRRHFELPKAAVYVHDSSGRRAAVARRRGYPLWDRDGDVRFQLVVGCSGQASFGIGDHEALDDDALLVSASSGSVELSRQDFIELADAAPSDDIAIRRHGIDVSNVHASIPIDILGRCATFANGGFPVNFTGRLAISPPPYMQPTRVLMVAAAVQAVRALDHDRTGRQELDPCVHDWLEPAFRELLGPREHWLNPPTRDAW